MTDAPAAEPRDGTVRRPVPRRRTIAFACAAAGGATLLAVALMAAVVWMARPTPTPECHAYYGLLRIVRENLTGTRVDWPEHPAGGFVYNRAHPHYRRPWSVPDARPADVPRRILMLGDSHLHGVCETSENMTSLLDEALAPAQVVNCGIFGWSPFDALRYYRDELRGKRFDDVVFVLFVGNDLSEMMRPGRARLVREGDAWVEREVDEAPEPYPGHLALALWRLGLRAPDSLPPSAGRALRAKGMAVISPGSLDQGGFQAMYFQDHPEEIPVALDMLAHVLQSMRDLTVERDATFRVVLVPTKNMTEPRSVEGVRRELTRVLGVEPRNLDFDAEFHGEVRAILARLGIPWTDLAPVLRAAAERAHASRPMFWFADFHLSTFGHAEAARALLPVLDPDAGRAADGVVPE